MQRPASLPLKNWQAWMNWATWVLRADGWAPKCVSPPPMVCFKLSPSAQRVHGTGERAGLGRDGVRESASLPAAAASTSHSQRFRNRSSLSTAIPLVSIRAPCKQQGDGDISGVPFASN